MTYAKERLKYAVLHAKTSQTAIAKSLGITKQQVGRIGSPGYESGKVAEAVAARLGVSLEWLVHGTGPEPSWFIHEDMIKSLKMYGLESLVVKSQESQQDSHGGDLLVKTVGRAAAARGASVDGDVDSEPPVRIRDRWRAVKIHGDSGYPVVLDGQSVLIDPALPCERNRIVVVHTDDGPQLKRIGDQLDDGRVMLASINAGLDPKLVRLSDYARAPEVVVGVVFTDSVAR